MTDNIEYGLITKRAVVMFEIPISFLVNGTNLEIYEKGTWNLVMSVPLSEGERVIISEIEKLHAFLVNITGTVLGIGYSEEKKFADILDYSYQIRKIVDG